MAGSDETGEEIEAGRVNRANDPTHIWAENYYTTTSILFIETGEFRVAFGGDVIFKVEVAKDTRRKERKERTCNAVQ